LTIMLISLAIAFVLIALVYVFRPREEEGEELSESKKRYNTNSPQSLSAEELEFFHAAKQDLFDSMHDSIDAVKMGLSVKLADKIYKNHDLNFAKKLSVAICNEIFSAKKSNLDKEHIEFAEQNHGLIKKEIEALSSNEEIKYIITHTIRAMSVLKFAEGESDYREWMNPIERVQKYGLFIPDRNRLSPQEIYEMAANFYQKAVKESEIYNTE